MKKPLHHITGLSVALALVVLINLGASFIPWKIDFTEEKRYTLTPVTRKLLQNLDTTVTVTVFLSGDLRSEFRKLSEATEDLLLQFRDVSRNRLRFRFEIPGEGMDDSLKSVVYDSLINLGLRPTNQKVQLKEGEQVAQRLIFPGALVRCGEQETAVDLLQGQVQKNVFRSEEILDRETVNRAEALLEFKFADAIQKVTRTSFPVVAYVYGNGEPPFGYDPVLDVFQALGTHYLVDTVNLRTTLRLSPQEHQALVIVKPTQPFTDDDKFKLDQYLMAGGNLMIFMDPLYAERDSLQQGDLVAYSRDLNLNDWLIRYGVKITSNLLSDRHCDLIEVISGSLGGQEQRTRLPWPYAPLLQPGSSHPIVKNQGDVLSGFASPVDTAIQVDGVKRTVLLETSTASRIESTPTLIRLNDLQTEESLSSYTQRRVPVAVLLEGRFRSPYPNQMLAAKDSFRQHNIPVLSESQGRPRLLVAGDADLVMNQVSEAVGVLPMGTNRFTRVGYANRDFFLNATEYLVNPDNVLAARSKDFTLRLIDPVKEETYRTRLQWLNLTLPLLLVILFGLSYALWRRRISTRFSNTPLITAKKPTSQHE